MKKIVFTLVFCVAACLATAFAQTAVSSAAIDTLPTPPRDGDSIKAEPMVMEEAPIGGRPVDFRLEDDDVLYPFMHKSTIPLPEEITRLIVADADAAVAKLENYKKSLKTKDPLQLLLLDAEFYGMLRYHEKFKKNYPTLMQKLKEEYGNRAEVIRFEIDELRGYTPEKVIEIADRMVKADAKYLPAYFIRGQEYLRLGETDKFCEDFDKLPQAIQNLNGNYKQCKK